MKIIDNKKDYYDYLMGVYGIDEKITYDRRCSITYDYYLKVFQQKPESIFIRIGYLVYRFYIDKKTKEWKMAEKIYGPYCWKGLKYVGPVTQNPRRIDKDELDKWYSKRIEPFNGSASSLCETPIVMYIDDIYCIKNPILSGWQMITKFISPETVWDMVYNFISSQKDKPIVDSRTDVQKLESAGFDKKTSFRNM